MKIANFPLVTRIIEARARLVQQRHEGKLSLRIDGINQDDEMIERIRPMVTLVLNHRIDELDADLVKLGVDVG